MRRFWESESHVADSFTLFSTTRRFPTSHQNLHQGGRRGELQTLLQQGGHRGRHRLHPRPQGRLGSTTGGRRLQAGLLQRAKRQQHQPQFTIH